jgi:hypothetical protein
MSKLHASDLRELQEQVCAGLVSGFGPRSLSAALDDVLDLILRVRRQKVTWAQIASALQPSFESVNLPAIDPATLRGICGRLDRRKKATKCTAANKACGATAATNLLADRTSAGRDQLPTSISLARLETQALCGNDRGPPTFGDKASRLAEAHRRLRQIR